MSWSLFKGDVYYLSRGAGWSFVRRDFLTYVAMNRKLWASPLSGARVKEAVAAWFCARARVGEAFQCAHVSK